MSVAKDIVELECSVCLHRFQDPVILNCGHTIDRSCVQQIINFSQSSNPRIPSTCPQCRRPFDPDKPLISNKSLNNIVKLEDTFEWFLIDICSEQEKTNLLRFLNLVFDRREIGTNHITFATDKVKIETTPHTNFVEQLQMKSIFDLQQMLQEACTYLKQQNGTRKICLITDGATKHFNVSTIDSNDIHQRFIIHVGDKNLIRTRQLAETINFQFGHFNTKTIDIYAQHFSSNF